MNAELFAAFLNEILAAHPNIESLNLKNHALDDVNIQALMNFINAAPTLKSLDVSDNFFTGDGLYPLHMLIEQKKTIFLMSDYTEWSNTHVAPLEYAYTKWILSPKQWKNEREITSLFVWITTHIQNEPDSIVEYLDAFKPEFREKNTNGWLPIIGSMKAHNSDVALALIKAFGLEDYSERLIKACQDPAVQNLEPEKSVPYFIHNVYLAGLNNPQAAYKVLGGLFPEPCPARDETLGRIAYFEKKYPEALAYLLAAYNKGATSCLPMLILFMQQQLAPDLMPYDRELLKSYVEKAAELGFLQQKIELGLMLIEEDDFAQAYHQLQAVDELLTNLPHQVSFIPPPLFTSLKKHIDFSINIEKLNDKLLGKRAELTQKRLAKYCPTLTAFNHERFVGSLQNTLGDASMKKLMETYRKILLRVYLNDESLFTKIEEYLFKKMSDCDTVNQGLLSMDPQKYAQAVVDEVTHFFDGHPLFGVSMKARVDVPQQM